MYHGESHKSVKLKQSSRTITYGDDTLLKIKNPSMIDSCPSLNIALRSLSLILSNEYLLMNFTSHFIPYDKYDGKFQTFVPISIMELMKRTFTNANIPKIIFSTDDLFDPPIVCAVYGCYKGRENEADIDIIYLNNELITQSKMNDDPETIIKYGSVILFTILHELGHWAFHHFSCAMDHDIWTPKGVLMQEAGEAIEHLIFGFKMQHYGPHEPKFIIDDLVTEYNGSTRIVSVKYLKTLFQSATYQNIKGSSDLQLSIIKLRDSLILQEELAKYSYKRVFNPIDEPVLSATVNTGGTQTGKRIFNSCDRTH
ncbi:unnamed protein product [Rotaria magnacalcarata]|uniref:Uncharacterized protein n=1 Tax=Rotaria magnacalcarata TaxID=392030 RepID=A0A815RNQ1_9BILA|nr:unnamed protein product [Rotaria magnacalcarata]CAF1480141.1 unnamed protein product [Rotaria magnacalcarata]CAF2124324.1 unnamed protein product [Rotaria magnacalcarata]CAF3824650.1 unnamed protein product [Rotaria magnacalcarata]CAF3826988.1 unnamed protein product [Rotaria magnacalcarata]